MPHCGRGVPHCQPAPWLWPAQGAEGSGSPVSTAGEHDPCGRVSTHRHSDYWHSGHTTDTATIGRASTTQTQRQGKALCLTVAAYMLHPRYLQQWHQVNTGGMCQSLHQGGKEEVHCPKLRKLLCTLGYAQYIGWPLTMHMHVPTRTHMRAHSTWVKCTRQEAKDAADCRSPWRYPLEHWNLSATFHTPALLSNCSKERSMRLRKKRQ